MEEFRRLEYKQYYARYLTIQDVGPKYLAWLNDDTVNEFLEVKNDNYTLADLQKYVETFQESKEKYLFGIFDKENETHIGNSTILNVDYIKGTFDIGYMIGDEAYWGKDASTAALLLMLKYSFEVLQLRKTFGKIFSPHVKARFTCKKVGFIEEARLKETAYLKGELCDSIIYTMNNTQWPEIKKKFQI